MLLAYGYLPDGGRRLLGVRASASAQLADYLQLLADLQLPCPPVTVVADDAQAVVVAVRAMWPAAHGLSPVMFAWEHHLRIRALAALKIDKADVPTGRWVRRLDTAFRRPEGWAEVRDACALRWARLPRG